MRRTAAALALLATLLPSLAFGQAGVGNFPQTVPDRSVVGRIGTGGGSGPTQAIPFATLSAQLFSGSAVSALFDTAFCSTPGMLIVRGASTWDCSSITGSLLPNPSTTTLGALFSKPATTGSLVSGVDNNGNVQIATTGILTAQDSLAFAVGRQGAVQPAFQVDSSVASSITGVRVSAQTAGTGTADIVAVGQTNVALRLTAAGSGELVLNGASTGAILAQRSVVWAGSSSGQHTVSALAAAGSGTSTWPTTTGTIINTGYYPPIRFVATAVNLNSVADTTFTINLPSGPARFRVSAISVINTGTTASLTTAVIGVYSTTGGGGTAYVTGAALSACTSNSSPSAGQFCSPSIGTMSTRIFSSGTQLFFRVETPQGAAATGDVILNVDPYP